MTMRRPVRVLVVDDSAVMRKLLSTALARDRDIEVVATAMDGLMALHKVARFRPDVITLDLEMPGMDGLEVLRQLQDLHDAPVLVVSAHTGEGAAITVSALSLGAVDVVTKPRALETAGLQRMVAELMTKVKAVAGRRWRRPRAAAPLAPPRRIAPSTGAAAAVVAIGVSTGGPAALAHLLPRLPVDLPAAFVVVQHMPEGFTAMLAHRLDQSCALEVLEARNGDLLAPGRLLLAPGGRHLRVRQTFRGPVATVAAGPEVCGHCPSADVLFRSVAETFGSRAIGVLLTGMGEDGAAGLMSIRAACGYTLAQDEESCVVFGMPKVAILRGAASEVVPLERMADAIVEAVMRVAGEGAGRAAAGLEQREAR
jgi:two-component system, chemotaxis family, protein-glutamate methylesterase/glutaminase